MKLKFDVFPSENVKLEIRDFNFSNNRWRGTSLLETLGFTYFALQNEGNPMFKTYIGKIIFTITDGNPEIEILKIAKLDIGLCIFVAHKTSGYGAAKVNFIDLGKRVLVQEWPLNELEQLAELKMDAYIVDISKRELNLK